MRACLTVVVAVGVVAPNALASAQSIDSNLPGALDIARSNLVVVLPSTSDENQRCGFGDGAVLGAEAEQTLRQAEIDVRPPTFLTSDNAGEIGLLLIDTISLDLEYACAVSLGIQLVVARHWIPPQSVPAISDSLEAGINLTELIPVLPRAMVLVDSEEWLFVAAPLDHVVKTRSLIAQQTAVLANEIQRAKDLYELP